MRWNRWTWVLASLAAAGAAHAAGIVDVSFKNPQGFTDVKDAQGFRDTNLRLLADDFQAFGKQLPDGQTLKIDVLDVKLAGEVRPRGGVSDIRVLNGGADWPRIKLRYTLQRGDQVLKSGEETVSDMSYLDRMPGPSSGEPLYYEKRMLNDWFTQRFVDGRPSPQ